MALCNHSNVGFLEARDQGDREMTKHMCESSNKGWFNFAGLQVNEVTRLKELSTCDKCKQPANLYVLIPALQMWVCERCRRKFWLWGLTILKDLIGYHAGDEI